MKHTYQRNISQNGLSVKAIINSVDEFAMHWHNEMEFILVLEGSVTVGVGETSYLLKKDDIILINSHEIHTTRKTNEDNILLVLQIDPQFFIMSFPNFDKIKFRCNSSNNGIDKDVPDILRTFLAKIVWELNKQSQGYELKIGAYLYQLAEFLLNNRPYVIIEEDEKLRDTELERIKRIVEYIKNNSSNKITLSDIAEKEHLNYHYLSHFIKSKLGMSFSDYLNSIRLQEAEKLLKTTTMSIINISNNTGFANVNSFNNLFREIHDMTPTEFRAKRVEALDTEYKSPSYLDVDRDKAFESLFKYLDEKSIEILEPNLKLSSDFKNIKVNTQKQGTKIIRHWDKLTSFSRAHEGLRASWQSQLKELQSDIEFDHIRFHGIFMDEMMVYNIDKEGNVIYNWTYVNELLDNFVENKIKPFFDMTFMPEALARTNDSIFWWKGNISPPKDIKLWTNLVQAFIKNCTNRYGKKEVSSWYFEVWNEPELQNVFWGGSQSEYFEFYKETVLAIKEVSLDIKVGGPSVTHGSILESNWLSEFLDFCVANDLPLDFVSVHIYPEYIPTESFKKATELIMNGEDINNVISGFKKVYHEKDYIKNVLNDLNKTIKEKIDYDVEVHITEWNASSDFGNLISDTVYAATYIVKNIVESINMVDSIAYWSFTDLMEEHRLGVSHFHGGFGLISKDGLKKPSYSAFRFLSKLGDEIIVQGEDYIITKTDENIQILTYNYTHFDDLFMIGENSHLKPNDRYSVYKAKNDLSIQFELSGLDGEYKISKYKLDRDHGSVYDEWVKIGAPENMSKVDVDYLNFKSAPLKRVQEVRIEEKHQINLEIPVHGIKLVLIEKVL